MVFRAKTLGLIDFDLYQSFFAYANKHGWRGKDGQEPGDEEYQGNESHSRFKQLVYQGVLEEKMSLSKGAGLLHKSLDEFRKELGETIHG